MDPSEAIEVFGRKKKSSVTEELRDTLYGDMPIDAWPPPNEEAPDEFPWTLFSRARADLDAGRLPDAVKNWLNVLEQAGLETRHYLQAWHFLRNAGVGPSGAAGNPVLGVVVEVAMHEGLDLLAAYQDHSARYYNYSGAGVVWERPDDSMDALIDGLLATSADVLRQIGPWGGARPSAPKRGHVRLSFLTPGGLHFGEGPIDAISTDPKGGPVLEQATILMNALIERTRAD
jgi:hypothetical protein